MIKTVFLDLDDTIFDFKACERQALAASLTKCAISFTDSDLSAYSEINDAMWKALERGEITRDELRVKRFEVFLSRFSLCLDAAQFADLYMDHLAATNVLIQGAREVLETLSKRYDLYAVTNGYEYTQRGRIRSADIGKYFKDIFISQCIGAVKPNKEFFDHCVRSIPDFDLSSTVLIGDSPTSDISGGNGYGLYTIRYNPEHLPNPEYAIPRSEVASLSEFPILLQSL